jgi:hypothetical protein
MHVRVNCLSTPFLSAHAQNAGRRHLLSSITALSNRRVGLSYLFLAHLLEQRMEWEKLEYTLHVGCGSPPPARARPSARMLERASISMVSTAWTASVFSRALVREKTQSDNALMYCHIYAFSFSISDMLPSYSRIATVYFSYYTANNNSVPFLKNMGSLDAT